MPASTEPLCDGGRCGVLHAAGVLQDKLLRSMGASHVSAVFAPKAHGASRLQRVWARSPLQSFLLFSSTTSTFGNAGQGNYGAANAYLDSLARARRVGGLRSCSMQLPMVTGAGMGQATVETLSAALAEQQKLWSLGLEQYASALSGLLARSAGSALAVQALVPAALEAALCDGGRAAEAPGASSTVVPCSCALGQEVSQLPAAGRQAHLEELVSL